MDAAPAGSHPAGAAARRPRRTVAGMSAEQRAEVLKLHDGDPLPEGFFYGACAPEWNREGEIDRPLRFGCCRGPPMAQFSRA